MKEQQNLIVAAVLSIGILLGWQYYSGRHLPPPTPTAAAPLTAGSALAPVTPAAISAPKTREESLAASPRLAIATPSLQGSLALKGARLDDLSLVHYRETPAADSAKITVLSPAPGQAPYYAEFGWVAAEAGTALPSNSTVWTAADAQPLTPEHPVMLTWSNGQGLEFHRTVALDKDYLFTVTDSVTSSASAPVTLFPYGLVSRWGTPKGDANSSVLHEGPIGVLDERLKEKSYEDLRKEHSVEASGKGGWLGFTDKYWLAALIPAQDTTIKGRMSWQNADSLDRYQADWLGQAISLAPGQTISSTSHLFAGAKELTLLDGYAESLHIPLFDHAIDFGMFDFLTKPFFIFLRWIHSFVPNFGIAILIFTVVVKAAFFPLANKSYHAMGKMKKLQPQIKSLQERFGEDKQRLNQEMMALYKKEKVNPVAGCLPILIQIPVFFSLYKVLYVTIEMRQAPFFGWIHDLSIPDPTTLFNLFGLIPWEPPQILHIGIWPLIMGVTMFVQQKLNPQPTDPVQAKMFTILPLVFTVMLANFPAGLVIYWAWSNLLTIAQQAVIMRQAEKEA